MKKKWISVLLSAAMVMTSLNGTSLAVVHADSVEENLSVEEEDSAASSGVTEAVEDTEVIVGSDDDEDTTEDDGTGPEITDVRIEESGRTLHPGDTIHYSALITDVNGVSGTSVVFCIESEDGGYHTLNTEIELNEENGRFEGSYTLSEKDLNGVYYISQMEAYDPYGNWGYADFEQNSSNTVTFEGGSNDQTGPEIMDVRIEEAGQTLHPGETVHYSVLLTDESGVRDINCYIYTKTESGRIAKVCVEFDRNEKTGRFEYSNTFSDTDLNGMYYIGSITGWDTHGNTTEAEIEQNEQNGIAFEGGVTDDTAPVITDVRVEEAGQTLHPGETVHFSALIADEHMGNNVIAYLRREYDDAASGYYLELNEETGRYEGSYTFSEEDVNGVHFIGELEAEDIYENKTIMEMEQNSSNTVSFTGGVNVPVITDVRVDEVGQTLHLGDSIHCSAAITAENGVREAVCYIYYDDTDDYRFASLELNEETGLYEGTYTFSENDFGGIYYVHEIIVTDNNSYEARLEMEKDSSNAINYDDGNDEMGPEIGDYTIAEAGQTLHPGDTIHFSVPVTDVNGIQYVTACLGFTNNEISEYWRLAEVKLEWNEETGLYEGSYILSEKDSNGQYSIADVRTADKFDNYSDKNYYFLTNDIVTFEGGVNDGIGPKITDVRIEEAGQTLHPGDSIHYSVVITAVKEIISTELIFNVDCGEGRTNTIGGELELNEETGRFEGCYTLSDTDLSGIYSISQIRAWDTFYNGATEDLEQSSTNMVTFEGGVDDRTGPEITDVRLEEIGQILHPGDTVHYSVSAVDESGVKFVDGYFGVLQDKGNYRKWISFELNKETGRFEGTYTFSDTDLNGIYYISSISLRDQYGNDSYVELANTDTDTVTFEGGVTDEDFPVITDARMEEAGQTLHAGDTIHFSAVITDETELYYMAHAYLRTMSQDGHSWISGGWLTLIRNNETGRFEGEYTIPDSDVSGRVYIYELIASDYYGHTTYEVSDINDTNYVFVETEKKEISWRKISDVKAAEAGQTVKTGSTGHFSVGIDPILTEDYECFGYMHVIEADGTEKQVGGRIDFTYDEKSGEYTAEYPFTHTADQPYGTYYIGEICIGERGLRRYYSLDTSDGIIYSDEEKPVEASGIELNESQIELLTYDSASNNEKDSTKQLLAAVLPENADNKNVIWKSSDEKIATVDQNGLVKALRYGTAVITASTEDGKYSASCEVRTKFYDAVVGVREGRNVITQNIEDSISWMADEGITSGYDRVNFGSFRTTSRADFIIFLWRYAGMPAANANSQKKFSDIEGKYNRNSATYKAIAWGVSNGIINGYGDGTFKPTDPVTRGQVAIMLWRYAGKPKVSGTAKNFPDVKVDKATGITANMVDAIKWASSEKLVNGYSNGKFEPNGNCLRFQMSVIIYRFNNNIGRK
ncbi:MAG: S-layer homology domain-containing protein [Eubacteriales bacterium]|nr:S-layer homology domain-containing protein [Eubacteriales bacterium]